MTALRLILFDNPEAKAKNEKGTQALGMEVASSLYF